MTTATRPATRTTTRAATVAPSPTRTPDRDDRDRLAQTGADIGTEAVWLAVALIGSGAALVLRGRR